LQRYREPIDELNLDKLRTLLAEIEECEGRIKSIVADKLISYRRELEHQYELVLHGLWTGSVTTARSA
jgi:hypothetical protein